MSWFTPPALLKKPRANEWLRLPSQIKIQRLRWLLLVGAAFFGLLAASGTSIVLYVLVRFMAFPRAYQLPIIVGAAIFGMCLGCALIMKMVYLAAAYGQINDTKTKSV